MPGSRRDGEILVVLGVLALLIVAYSLLIAQQILLGVVAIGWLFGLYLVWRLIRALERIADALEAQAESRSRGERRA